jgi:murein DD-endopeptidase MepM/ murein hydrolase activator NlpD
MIVSFKNQKIKRRHGSSGNLPVKYYRNFFRDSAYRLGESLRSLEENLARVIAGNPLFHYPYYAALILFVLVLGILIPFVYPPAAYQFSSGITLPLDQEVPSLLLHIDNPNYLLGTLSSSDGSPLETPSEAMLAGLESRDYEVQSGESISEIAYDFELEVDTLISFNNITNVRRLRAGTVIKIPNMDGILYEVKRGDSLSAIAGKFEVSYESLLDTNQMDSAVVHPGTQLFIPGVAMNPIALKQAMGELFVYPARGRITSPYGWRSDPITGMRRFHTGVDIANSPGTRVNASMEGRIGEVGFHSTYGNYVIINHAGGFQTLYAHLNRFVVSKGQWVNQGQKVGEMGSTGYSTGSHVHFTIFKHNQHINPLNYIH